MGTVLSENKSNFSKIFEVYTRRSKQLSMQAWLAFCADFDLTEALSTSVLGTIFRGAAGDMDVCLSMKGFLQALRHTALYLVTMESEERGSGFFGRTTIHHRQQ